ncbi:MAG: AAA family ATPase [Deltaproteobacteria bacterium]|nr:AAA family ATPase [Deltaproteobacteria bacterium]MCW8892060.1 AAA family ATPase [Deltaproteobacteria bacterium]MCW9050172.1 AAA family ATPase [Deltaproteobacteria bacterium]
MCKKIFIAATGQNCGKTTTSLSLLHLAQKKYQRVGFIKPFGPKRTEYLGRAVDVDAALMAHVYGMKDQLALMSPVVLDAHTTREVLEGKNNPQLYLEQIRRATEELEKKCDFLIIEGAGHSGVGSVMGMNNAQLAKQLDAPVLLVAGGGIGNVIDALHLNLALFRETGAEVRMILPNKLVKKKREAALHYLQLAFKNTNIKVVGGFNYSPILANPTMTYLSELLKLELKADAEQASRIVHHVQLGAASTQRIVDLLRESTLVIVPSSRDEVLVMLATLYHLPEYQLKLAGLVINGVAPLADVVERVLDDAKIPYMRTDDITAEIYTTIKDDVAKIRADDAEKIALVQQLAENELDFSLIDSLF